jgi:hypothetical protein
MKVRITLTEEMLGTKAANKDVFADFIASKCPDDDLRKQELQNAEHIEEAGTSVFHRNSEGKPILYDYQLLGFLKEAGDIMRQATKDSVDEETGKKVRSPWGNAKKKFDNFVMIKPREIPIDLAGKLGICERPLRVMTMRGERVSVARSETVPAGSSITFDIDLMPGGPVSEKMVKTCLLYGARKGLGQWRNSGKGRFEWELL